MSEYLWGIAQLVNDPSNDLLNLIQKRISGKQSEHTLIPKVQKREQSCNDTNVSEIKLRERIKNESNSACNPETSGTIKIKENKQTKSKCMQIGNPLSKYSEVAVQTQKVITHASKTTSIQQITFSSRSTEAAESKVKKDVCTEIDRKKLCKDHQEVFTVLQNWSEGNEDANKRKLITRMMLKMRNFVSFFEIKKIQNYPEYYGPQEEVMKLYREASYNKLQ